MEIFNPISLSVIISLVILGVLLILSALISGSEVAFFSLTPTEKESLNNEESKSNQLISALLAAPKKLLATILISNNFVNVAIIILSSYLIKEIFNFSAISEWVIFSIQVVGITFSILLFGEVIPKVYATKHALKLAKIMALPISVLKKITSPFSQILIQSSKIIDKRIKKKSLDISMEELSHALDLAEGTIENKEEHKILKGIVKFGETSVKQVMKSRVDVVAIEKKTGYTEVIKIIMNSGHSRIPIYDESFDNILGLLYIKDLIPYINEKDDYNWLPLIRNPFFVPENKKLDDLLKEFQEKKIHLAIVVDEYGGTSGIITLEDVLEEIVGEISDEFDTDDISYSKLDENTYIFDGKTGLNDISKILTPNENTFTEVTKGADTLAGLVIEIAGKIPQKNERIVIDNFIFIVEAADKRRVKRVKLIHQQ
ncbi:MAG: gliding motility-associated protein GldE [Vicingus serpentipes]|nr:gliding motility-associated protein GldE [Vicingus serpentipes]